MIQNYKVLACFDASVQNFVLESISCKRCSFDQKPVFYLLYLCVNLFNQIVI